MPFNTLSYYLFLPVVFLLHYFTPDRFRWLVLLAASFCFYAALKAPHLIAVLLLITTTTYFTGIWIDQKETPRIKQYILWGGISANVLTLIILKYLPFITQNINLLLKQLAPGTTVPVSKTIIAIGVSYFIFKAISYLIDIFLEIEKPERHFGHFALYMSFFPNLLQGPIERCGALLPQFKIAYAFNYDNVRAGLLLFSLGLLKKAVIADRLAIIVNPVFNDVYAYKGLPLLLATGCYSLQIYFDFSGYTDMALGTAMMFNITLTQNFNNPYFATSIADFWHRWHISFSRWILDYVFKPLQLSWREAGSWGTALALLVTFSASGIWHGAGWGFVVWGILHGVFMACSVFYRPYQKKLHQALGIANTSLLRVWQIFVTFSLVSFSWVFFRANDVQQAFYVVSNILGSARGTNPDLLLAQEKLNLVIIAAALLLITLLKYLNHGEIILVYRPTWQRWSIYYLIIITILLFRVPANQFIYAKF